MTPQVRAMVATVLLIQATCLVGYSAFQSSWMVRHEHSYAKRLGFYLVIAGGLTAIVGGALAHRSVVKQAPPAPPGNTEESEPS